MMWSRFAAAGTALYLVIFASAFAYPLFDHRTVAGLAAVMLGLPWIDYFPGSWFPAAIALNALIIYCVLAALSFASGLFRRKKTNSVSS
jgi:hypothetical protein